MRTVECKCPTCGKRIDSATAARGKERKPRPGDLSVCIECSEVLVFNQDLTVRHANLNDLAGLPDEQSETIELLQTLIRSRRVKGLIRIMEDAN